MFHQHAPMPYPPVTRGPRPSKPVVPTHHAPAGYQVPAEEPRRFSIRTVVVILISVLATGISAFRIRDAFQQDRPQPSPFQEFQKQNPEYSELVSAIRERDYDHVEAVITRWPWLVNYTRTDLFGPPLVLAAAMNQPDVVDLLIDRGAEINCKGRWGGTALHWAAWRGSADAIDALVHRGANLEAESDNDGSTPLFWACRGSREGFWGRGNYPLTVQKLLDAGADPDNVNRDGFYAASIAAEEIVPQLLAKGATPRQPATQPTFGTATGEYPRLGIGLGYGYRRDGH